MSGKSVNFNRPQPREESAERWVSSRNASADLTMKRLTIDVSYDLHRRIKGECAMRGAKMSDVLRELLEDNFPGSDNGN